MIQVLCENNEFTCENNTIKAQDICLDTEQNVCHFKIYSKETPETVLVYIDKGCVCIKTSCESMSIDHTTIDTSNHS